jgi:hypothetical protein
LTASLACAYFDGVKEFDIEVFEGGHVMSVQNRETSGGSASEMATDPRPTTGYVLLSASVDGHTGPAGAEKRHLIATLKAGNAQLRRDLFATVGILTARRCNPRTADFLQADERTAEALPVRYDLAVLLQAPSVEAAHWLTADPAFVDLRHRIAASARRTHVAVVHNVRRSHCEYGPQTRQLYVLMGYRGGDTRAVIPAWGWTHRREMLSDLAFSRTLRRFRSDGRSTRYVLYGLA